MMRRKEVRSCHFKLPVGMALVASFGFSHRQNGINDCISFHFGSILCIVYHRLNELSVLFPYTTIVK